MNFDELSKYALLLASVISGWLAVITDKEGKVRTPALAITGITIALLAGYLGYRDYQSAQTILVAHYPGYHKGVRPRDPSKIVYVTAPTYEDLQNGVRNNRKADVLILSSGIYAGLLKNESNSGIADLMCFVADQQKKGSAVDRYQPALLMNNHCPNFDSIRKMREDEALTAVASELKAAEMLSPGAIRKRVLFVDPFSASGFYVPVKELGLIETILKEPLIRCASSHKAAIARARTSRECVITPTNFDELEISNVIDATGAVRDRQHLTVIPLRYQIPRSPHCVRKRFFGGEKSFFQSNFEADQLSLPEPERYRQLYDDYIGPIVESKAGHVNCDSADDAPKAGPPFSALYVDLDGTLLKPMGAAQSVGELEPLEDGKFGLNRQDIEALKKFTACGGQIGFATGRTFSQIPSQLLDLKPQLPFVLANGAIVQDAAGQLIASTPLPKGAAKELVVLSQQLRGVAATVIQFAQNNVLIRAPGSKIEGFLKGGRLEVTECADISRCELLDAGDGSVFKVMFVARVDEAVALSKAAASRVRGRFSVATGGGADGWMSIEINALDADKHFGIQSALSRAGLDMKDLVVFGDGRNDVSMLGGVGVSFASSYAPAEAQNAAMAVANPNGPNDRISGQVGRVIERFLLQTCQ